MTEPDGRTAGRAERPAGPRRSWGAGPVAVAVLALLAIGALLAAAALGGARVLDPGAVERDVAAQFQQRDGVPVVLTCPAEMAVRLEATYRCTGTTEAGEEVTVLITVTDEASAAYTWAEP